MTVQTTSSSFDIAGEPARPVATPSGRTIAIWLAGIAIAILAILARVWHTRSSPLWLDEAYSLYAAQHDWRFLWHVVPRYETHPPLYYSLVHVWRGLFGESVVALRSLGYAAGFATIGMVYLAGREIGARLGLGRRVALAATLLAAFAVPLVEMSREVRPYPILILAYATALFALLRATRPGARTLASGWFALYCAAYGMTLWLHNLGPLYGAALGIGALTIVARRDLPVREWAIFLGGHALAILLWVPALLILREQAAGWMQSTWLTFTFHDLHWKLMLLWGAPGAVATIPTCALLALGLERIGLIGRDLRLATALLVAMVLPVLLSVLISVALTPVFIPRTLTATAIPAVLLAATALAGGEGWRRLAALFCGAIVLATTMMMDLGARQGPPPQQWYALIDWLDARYRPGDIVLAYPNEGALPFAYAVRDRHAALAARPIPGPVPALGYPAEAYPTGSRGVVSLPPARLRAIAAEPEVVAAPTIWLLRLGAAAYDEDDMFLHALEAAHRPVARFRSGPIDLIGLRRPELLTPAAPTLRR